MESRVARQFADKVGLYLSKRGKWDFGKSEKRKREILSILLSKRSPLPITRFELSYLKKAESEKAISKLLSAIFNQKRNNGKYKGKVPF